jgi:hypothetical protein
VVVVVVVVAVSCGSSSAEVTLVGEDTGAGFPRYLKSLNTDRLKNWNRVSHIAQNWA